MTQGTRAMNTEPDYAEEILSIKQFAAAFVEGITSVELEQDIAAHLFSPEAVRRLASLIPHLEVTLPAHVERNYLKEGKP